LKKELAIIFILSILVLSAGEMLDYNLQGGRPAMSSSGPFSVSFAVNSINVEQVGISFRWVTTSYAINEEKPTVAYFIPGTTWGLSYWQESFPFVWFNSSSWRLVDTDNQRFWRWEVTNIIYNLPWSQEVPLNFQYSPIVFYPWDMLVLDVYIGSTQAMSDSSPPKDLYYAGPVGLVVTDQPKSAFQGPFISITSKFDHDLSPNSVPTDFSYRLGQLGFHPSFYYHLRILVSHPFEVRLLALLGLVFAAVVQPLLVWRVIRLRKFMANSNYLQTCLGFLLFLPILLFTFRTSVAPPWITNLDLFLLLDVFAWAVLLLDRLTNGAYQTIATSADVERNSL
jgi:hypothetical protein